MCKKVSGICNQGLGVEVNLCRGEAFGLSSAQVASANLSEAETRCAPHTSMSTHKYGCFARTRIEDNYVAWEPGLLRYQ
jgi:hypothetical protein